MHIHFQLIILLLLFTAAASAQTQKAVVYGTVTDQDGKGAIGVTVYHSPTGAGAATDSDGHYEITIPAGAATELAFSYITTIKKTEKIPALNPGQRYILDVELNTTLEFGTLEIIRKSDKNSPLVTKIDPKIATSIPTAGSGIEALIKTLPGVSSNNELSSQYSVRGGNFDENLVYINGIEIYRPLLVRSGQQEGLSIINSELVDNIAFSAGGFESHYGDKLSSVLDIAYKEPVGFEASASAGLLGANMHVGGSTKNHRFTYLAGARYHTNRYLLGSLETSGDYTPSFTDLQAYFTYDVSTDFTLGWLTYYGRNRYQLVPETRETTFGTPNLVVRLSVYFDGQEILEYNNLLNGLIATWKPNDNTELRWTASAYQTIEQERFDIIGQYYLDQLETDPNSDNFGGVRVNLGVGGYLNHARNDLYGFIYNFEHSGKTSRGNWLDLRWGARYQNEFIADELREYRYLDSADFSVPVSRGDLLEVDELIRGDIELHSHRLNGYVQNTFTLNDSSDLFLTTGVRGNFWSYNNEFFVTPRVHLLYKPNKRHNMRVLTQRLPDSLLRSNWQLRASAGLYYQSPFYRELRTLEGSLNPEIVSQKSAHFVVGSDLVFNMWDRPFKWSAEIYYKHMWDLIPYDVQDVRIRYLATNNAEGYAAGVDMQLHGEFIKGLPSWASLSVMQTKERLDDSYFTQGDTLVPNPGFIPRPTDQRVQVGILFQDHLPSDEDAKVHLNFLYGSSLPFGPPGFPRFRNMQRMPAYVRVDLGFSYQLLGSERERSSNISRKLESLWISGEVFNMFGIRNTVGHFYIKDIGNNLWAIPNYLTNRRFNIRVVARM